MEGRKDEDTCKKGKMAEKNTIPSVLPEFEIFVSLIQGIERDHPDLIRSYDPFSSTDINDNDNDPRPRYDYSDSNGHGTRCAGQVKLSKLQWAS